VQVQSANKSARSGIQRTDVVCSPENDPPAVRIRRAAGLAWTVRKAALGQRQSAFPTVQPKTGENAYAFAHSLVFLRISQKTDRFEWLIEGAQDAVNGLTNDALAPGRQGQLGLGRTYFVAHGNRANNASGFLNQAYIGAQLLANGEVRVGRFDFSDGTEVKPTDKTIAELVNTRIAQRLIGDFTFSAVQARRVVVLSRSERKYVQLLIDSAGGSEDRPIDRESFAEVRGRPID
jgi:hypothetical protein